MINTNTLARPYAKAAFEFASAAQQADAWLNMLSLSAAAVQAPAMAQQLVNPALTDEQKVNVLAQLCAGHIDASFSNFLRSLGSNDRLSLLPVVREQFAVLKAEAERVVKATVTSAQPLDAGELEMLRSSLRKRFGREVELATAVDAGLIGGAVIDTGEVVIDGSLRTKLARLGAALAN